MSYNLRMRRVAYDNIAGGSATGRERVKGTNSTELLAKEALVAGGTPGERTTDCLDHILNVGTGKTTEYVNETIAAA